MQLGVHSYNDPKVA